MEFVVIRRFKYHKSVLNKQGIPDVARVKKISELYDKISLNCKPGAVEYTYCIFAEE